MHRKVAGEFLHDVNANTIAGSDILSRVRYHILRICVNVYCIYYYVSIYLLFCCRAPTIASFY